MHELEKQIVSEFLKLGLFEKWLGEIQLEAVNAFNLSEVELVDKIRQFHARRAALLAFQQFLESRSKLGD